VEGEGIMFWAWSPEYRSGVVEAYPSVPLWCGRWGIVTRNGRGSRSRPGLDRISMPVLDNVPFILPGLTLDSPKLEQFSEVHDLILRIETAFEEEIVVDLEHG
jgi:hypothetical protein